MSTPAPVTTCSVTSCAYNNGGCSAFAITVAGSAAQPNCTTFVALDARGGLPSPNGRVGACQRLECAHNDDLMCTAEGITVGGDTASCMSFTVR
jgi:hypothetical protein